MPINKDINLDLPVDAYDADGNLKGAAPVSEETSTEVSQTEEKKDVVEPTDEEEQRVPYSRFAKIREQKEHAEREAEEAREIVRSLARSTNREVPQERATSSYDEDYAKEIKRLYGDTPVAEEIISINTKHMRDIEERAERRAIEAVGRMRDYETRAVSQNENVIDQRLEALSDTLGRSLTEKEESEILSIIDEYTPTGDDGKYLGELLPFDKAWEVYELRQERRNSSSQQNRRAALQASGTRSHGEPSGTSNPEADKAWNPLNWKSLYDRIGKN